MSGSNIKIQPTQVLQIAPESEENQKGQFPCTVNSDMSKISYTVFRFSFLWFTFTVHCSCSRASAKVIA